MYGEWIRLNRPCQFSKFPKYLRYLDFEKFKSTYKSDKYWHNESNLKGEFKNAYLFYWADEPGEYIPYKLAIEIDGRQHCTIDCHKRNGVTSTACYIMTNHLNADSSIKYLNKRFRKGDIKRIKLNKLNIKKEGTCFIVSFKNVA